jgi:hypothetical protein
MAAVHTYMRKNALKRVDMALITFFEGKAKYQLLKKHVTTLMRQ